MNAKERRIRFLGWPAIVVGFLLLGAVGCLFLPLIGTYSSAGTLVNFSSVPLLFGGLFDTVVDGYPLSMGFSLNIGMLITGQLMILAALSSFFGKNNPRNLMIAIVLVILSAAGVLLFPYFTAWANKGLVVQELVYGYGSYIVVGILFLCLILLCVLYRSSWSFWKKRRIR